MTEAQYTAVVKPGLSHGVGRRYQAGDTVVLTEAERQSFGDKFTNIRPLQPDAKAPPTLPDSDDGFDFGSATVPCIMDAIAAGETSAEAAVAYELTRPVSRQRKSILGLVGDEEE